jgi:CRISPR system Cascade subunit CasE
MTALWLTRARLRQDANLAALAPVLLPDDANARAGVAHRLVWTLFADNPDRRRDFLWREDKPGQFMLLSARPPDSGSLFSVETKPFAPVLGSGDRLHFILRANPTVAHAVPNRARRSPRSDVVMAALKPIPQGEDRQQARPRLIQEAGAAWLRQKGEKSGFKPVMVKADGYDQRHIPRDGKAPITLSTLDFEGVLAVTDPPIFLAALASGFGRARAFGCGLMLIRRAA